jgi:hypothetical protein
MSLDDDDRRDYDDDFRGTKEPHRGVLILVMGILGLMVCGVVGIFAWMMGKKDLELMSIGQMDKEGEALTKVGYILGIVGTILFLIQLLCVVGYILLFVVAVAAKK